MIFENDCLSERPFLAWCFYITILSIFKLHPDAKELYNVNGSLRRVCETLRDPNLRLNEIEISLFNPFKPVSLKLELSSF